MRGVVVNGDKLQIKQFKNVLWCKIAEIEKLPVELKKLQMLQENIEKNGHWYLGDSKEYMLFAFSGNIGKEEHPLIENPCICNWYSSDSGGVYIVGMDKKTGELFAPVVN